MWRPDGWDNPYTSGIKSDIDLLSEAFEAGADAMLEALLKLAKESPTGTFTIDSHAINIYEEK